MEMPSFYCKASNELVYANGKKIALNIGWSLSWLGIILFIVYTIQNMQFKL